jgi:3-phenylpropionate/cinnamic acid dioxygenase small subunit
MLKRTLLAAMALSVGIATVVALRAQQAGKRDSTTAPVLTALDYLEIQQLVTRYAYAVDTGADNGNMYAGLFAPAGVFLQRTGQAVTGRDALAALAVRNKKGTAAVFHFIMNHVIEPSAGGAIGKEYLAQLTIGNDGTASTVFGGGHYDDEYVKTAEGWRFQQRQFIPSQSGAQPAYHSPSFGVPARAALGVNARPSKAPALTPADYVEIQQLISRYPYGLDTGGGMGDLYASLFTPDATFVAGTLKVEGREKLKAFAWQHRPGQGPLYTRNFSTNASIEVSPEGAKGKIFAVVFDIGEGGKPSAILNGGHYEDNYVKTPDGWRIKRREFVASEDGPPPPKLPQPAVAKETAPVPLLRPKDVRAQPLTAQDYIDIQQLAARYSHALDTGADNGYAYADLFTSDAVAFDKWVGREKIAEIPRWNPHGPKYVRHYAMNHLIEPTADGAIGKQYVVVIDIGKNGKASSIFLGGHYEDVYVRTPNGWRFKSRTEFRSKSDAQPNGTNSSRH